MTLDQVQACWTITIGQTLKTMKFTKDQEKRFYNLLQMNWKVQTKQYEKEDIIKNIEDERML